MKRSAYPYENQEMGNRERENEVRWKETGERDSCYRQRVIPLPCWPHAPPRRVNGILRWKQQQMSTPLSAFSINFPTLLLLVLAQDAWQRTHLLQNLSTLLWLLSPKNTLINLSTNRALSFSPPTLSLSPSTVSQASDSWPSNCHSHLLWNALHSTL